MKSTWSGQSKRRFWRSPWEGSFNPLSWPYVIAGCAYRRLLGSPSPPPVCFSSSTYLKRPTAIGGDQICGGGLNRSMILLSLNNDVRESHDGVRSDETVSYRNRTVTTLVNPIFDQNLKWSVSFSTETAHFTPFGRLNCFTIFYAYKSLNKLFYICIYILTVHYKIRYKMKYVWNIVNSVLVRQILVLINKIGYVTIRVSWPKVSNRAKYDDIQFGRKIMYHLASLIYLFKFITI